MFGGGILGGGMLGGAILGGGVLGGGIFGGARFGGGMLGGGMLGGGVFGGGRLGGGMLGGGRLGGGMLGGGMGMRAAAAAVGRAGVGMRIVVTAGGRAGSKATSKSGSAAYWPCLPCGSERRSAMPPMGSMPARSDAEFGLDSRFLLASLARATRWLYAGFCRTGAACF